MIYESEESFKIYLREISQTPLLSIEEENFLAEKIKNGTPEEKEKARDHMIRANLRLVVKLAQDYANYGVPVSDLISEGNIGLMKAVERFDPEKGGKVSTYAAWWIKQSIKRALANQSKTIRLPVHMVDKIAKIRRIANILSEALGREPTHEELADEVGVPVKNIRDLFASSQRPVSLDAPINDGESTEYGEVIADEGAENPLDMLSDKNIHGELDDLLLVLDERERRIIDDRFGLSGKEEMTLEEVGLEFGVTRERIRQLQNAALLKMRNALRKKEKQPRIVTSFKKKPVPQENVLGEKSRKIPHKKTGLEGIKPISIPDDDEYNRYLDLLLNHKEVQALEGARGSKYLSAKTFLQKMDAIVIPGEQSSAAEILKAVITYNFASGKGGMPQNSRAQHLVDFLRNRRVA